MTPPLALLHLCDSLFPTGAFAYSDGLEAATVRLKPDTTKNVATKNVATKNVASGFSRTVVGRAEVADGNDLRDWLDVCLEETFGRTDAPTVWQAWDAFHDRDWRMLAILDRELTALRPSSTARRSSRAMGLRLLTTWHALHPDPRLEEALGLAHDGRIGPTLPVAFACACACAGVARRQAVEAFAYTRLAATISAAMRLMRIGQTDAHALLARTLERVHAVVDRMIECDRDIESFTPAMDIAMMTQQYLHSRLFRS